MSKKYSLKIPPGSPQKGEFYLYAPDGIQEIRRAPPAVECFGCMRMYERMGVEYIAVLFVPYGGKATVDFSIIMADQNVRRCNWINMPTFYSNFNLCSEYEAKQAIAMAKLYELSKG